MGEPMKIDGGKVVRQARQTAVASRALNRRINLDSASAWCRARLAQELAVRA